MAITVTLAIQLPVKIHLYGRVTPHLTLQIDAFLGVYKRVTRPLKFYLYIEAGEGVNHSLHMTFRGAVHPPPTPKSTQ